MLYRFHEFFEDSSRAFGMSRLQAFLGEVALIVYIGFDTYYNRSFRADLAGILATYSSANYLITKNISAGIQKKQLEVTGQPLEPVTAPEAKPNE